MQSFLRACSIRIKSSLRNTLKKPEEGQDFLCLIAFLSREINRKLVSGETARLIANNECQGCCYCCDASEYCPEETNTWCKTCYNHQCVHSHKFSMKCNEDCDSCKNTRCVENYSFDPEDGPLKDC